MQTEERGLTDGNICKGGKHECKTYQFRHVSRDLSISRRKISFIPQHRRSTSFGLVSVSPFYMVVNNYNVNH